MALPQGALFWPARRALLVADLHLEKASWFARLGQMLPPYDSIATLSDLTVLAMSSRAQEIWCLGDGFHDRDGCNRLPRRAREMLRDRKRVVSGKSVSVRVDLGGRRGIKKNKQEQSQ